MKPCEFKDGDMQTLRRLCQCVRMVTAEQEAQLQLVSFQVARKRLDRLHDCRLVCRLSAWASEIPSIKCPLASWTPGENPPDFGAIAYAAQRRWYDKPVRQTTIYVASDKALRLFALTPRPKLKLSQASHDLGCTEMHLWLRARWQNVTKRLYRGEDTFCGERGHGEKVEDGQFRHNGRILTMLEYAGAYRKDRVEAFHRHAESYNVRYLIF